MRLCVVAIGQRMPAWIDQGWKAYADRFPPAMPLELREVPAERRTRNADIESIRRRECDALLAAAGGSRLVALDAGGRQWSTVELAERLEHWMQLGTDVSFLVGGPDGLTPECIARADQHWSLSRLTLPHAIVRVLLAEQIYRAWTIIRNHPYHRA